MIGSANFFSVLREVKFSCITSIASQSISTHLAVASLSLIREQRIT